MNWMSWLGVWLWAVFGAIWIPIGVMHLRAHLATKAEAARLERKRRLDYAKPAAYRYVSQKARG